MENWKNTEGIKPEIEEYKGFRGAIAWLIIVVVMYTTLLVPFFDVPANELLREYGISVRMQGWDAFFWATHKILKFFASIFGACIVRKIINIIISKKNDKIVKENQEILIKNGLATETNEQEISDLISRLEKGKQEVKKYENFFKKRDKYHSFYGWKKKYTIFTILTALMFTPYITGFIIYVIAIICNIVFGLLYMNNPEGLNAVSQWLDPLLLTMNNILWIASTVCIGVLTKPFVKMMQNKADKLQEEDERNGYTAAIDNVIPDVPERYRKEKLMKELIKLVNKHGFETVQEAIDKYEFNLKLKKGIAFAITAIAIFGVFNGINNAINNSMTDFSNNMRAATNSTLKHMDESKMESMARRQMHQQEQAMRNTWANQQQQANNLYNNAARFNPNSNEARQAMQHANDLQRKANETARQFNNLFGK